MNSYCAGTYLAFHKLYRCFWDGGYVRAKTKPEVCAHCSRPVDFAKTVRKQVRFRTVTISKTQIKLPGYLSWVAWDEKTKTTNRGLLPARARK
jgi:hypothetical protein